MQSDSLLHPLTRIAVANDYPLFLRSLTEWINAKPGISICKSFADAADMVRWYDGSNADLLIFDNQTPAFNAIEESRFLLAKFPAAKIILLSVDDETANAQRLKLIGISAWFKKGTYPDAFLNTINSLCVPGLLKGSKRIAPVRDRCKEKLSKREIEIINHITQGKTTLQIACDLNLSPLTIKTHRQNLLKKLNVSNTPQLLEKARFEGYLK